MEPLFRLVLNRPATQQDENAPSIPLAQATPFQTQLAQAPTDSKRRGVLKTAARQFVASAGFIGSPKQLPLAAQLEAFAPLLDELETAATPKPTNLANAVARAFGQPLAKVISGGTLPPAIALLKDSIIAIKLLPEEHHRDVEGLSNQLRMLELILKAAADNTFPTDAASLRRYRRRSLLLPTEMDRRSILSTADKLKEAEKQRKEAEEKRQAEANAKLAHYKLLRAAISELTRLAPGSFESTPQTADAGSGIPAQFRPIDLAVQELIRHQQSSQIKLLREQTLKEDAVARLAAADRPELTLAAADWRIERNHMVGKGALTSLTTAANTFRVRADVERNLSAVTLGVLKERNLSLSSHSVDFVAEALRQEAVDLGKDLDQLAGRPAQLTFKRVGKSMVMVSQSLASPWNVYVTGLGLGLSPTPLIPVLDSIPHTHGNVAPAGIADLLVVRQQLVRYEGADVAHIENILKGESKKREHSTRRETEEFSLRESETTTSEERELESTSRFEMSRETSETIREDASLKAGLSVSGKYGPAVEFSASAEGSVSRSKEEATRSAATFSQDVTERSATKITERVLERSSLRVTNEVIEKNTHELNNSNGTRHISGVYQWVNKVYQAQMFNYGIRTMYDFMVAEPAAFLIQSMQSAHMAATELEKPAAFTLRPDQIDEWNYYHWVKEYGATDVQPPPELYKTKSADFKAGGGDSSANYNHSGQIALEEGYKAIYGTIGYGGNIWSSDATVDVVLGRRMNRFTSQYLWGTNLDEETDSIPFAIDTLRYSQIAVAIEVKCQRTDRAMKKWRLETHAKLTTAYKARLSEYEEKLAALEVQAGVTIRGRNPLLNVQLMNEELKKHCLSILTEQHFDLFGAIESGAYGVPQLDLSENQLEGPYVRFFEQAFEWEQMTWIAYPYFWGRKSTWAERISYEDTDSIFNQFLKAGYCRVVVPVRLGFEGAVDHFMKYGEVWNGGPLPPISDPLYLPIADEIAERLDRPGDEIPQGDPWFVRIPTTLVHLRADDKLPQWKQNAAGEWVEA